MLLLILFVGALVGGWLYYTGKDQAACEEKGGFWNKNTMTCEEKVPFLKQVGKLFENM